MKAFHKDGIHDDHLRLIRRSPLIDELDEADRTADPRKPKSRMTQCQWYYPVKLPEELSMTNPNNGRPCFVYRINLVLIEKSGVARDKKQYKIYRQDQVPGKLGLLVSSRLPEVALQTFHLFTISGKVLCQLDKVYEAVKWPS